MSKGAQELLKLVKQIFPHQRVEFEYNVAERGALFVDIYLPHMKLGFEYDGEQHFKYCEHFHGTRENFLRAKRRDAEKDEVCQQKGITLIRMAHFEEMSKDTLLAKLEEAVNE